MREYDSDNDLNLKRSGMAGRLRVLLIWKNNACNHDVRSNDLRKDIDHRWQPNTLYKDIRRKAPHE